MALSLITLASARTKDSKLGGNHMYMDGVYLTWVYHQTRHKERKNTTRSSILYIPPQIYHLFGLFGLFDSSHSCSMQPVSDTLQGCRNIVVVGLTTSRWRLEYLAIIWMKRRTIAVTEMPKSNSIAWNKQSNTRKGIVYFTHAYDRGAFFSETPCHRKFSTNFILQMLQKEKNYIKKRKKYSR